MWRFDSSSQKNMFDIVIAVVGILKILFYKKYLVEVGLKKYMFG